MRVTTIHYLGSRHETRSILEYNALNVIYWFNVACASGSIVYSLTIFPFGWLGHTTMTAPTSEVL